MSKHELYMERCLELAMAGAGSVAPNPMVGAVLVYKDQIIGEGYHQKYGGPHAEPNCINSVAEAGKKHIADSTLYVSLEPCAHFGKTPPCADLIIAHKIKNVVIGCRDPFEAVNGKGIDKLIFAGVKVETGILEQKAIDLNKRFFTFHLKKRPYIILKWAETNNNFIASASQERLLISNEYSNRIVHQWRSEEAGILIGTNTTLKDDPELTNRYWSGPSPIRLVIDLNLRLPASLKVFRGGPTIIFNHHKNDQVNNVRYFRLGKSDSLIQSLLPALYQLNIQSVLVEGGAQLLKSFIDAGIWDEARIISNRDLTIEGGLAAPRLTTGAIINREIYKSDSIETYLNANNR